MTIDNIVNLLTGIIESIMMVMLCETFFTKRPNIPKWIYGISVVILASLVNISNTYFNYGIWNTVGMIVSFFLASLLYKGNFPLKAILSVLNYLIIAILEVVVLFAITIVYDISVVYAVEDTTYRILGIVVSKMLALLVANTLRLKFRKTKLYVSSYYWILFLIMFMSSTVTIFLIFKLSYSINDSALYNLSVLCSFGLLFSTFFALYLYEHLAKQAETIRKQEQYEQNLKLQSKHLGEILVTQNQIKSFKHDFQNFIIGLQSYIDGEDYGGVNSYIKGLQDMFKPSTNIIETGNVALDAIISTKKAIAENKGIEFNTKIQIPKQMSVDPIDICIIFGNALDNAIEACENITNGQRKISVTVICQNETVFCRVVNTAPKPKKTLFKTTKADKQNHGFGLENIKMALAKFNSEPSIIHDEDEFTLKFVFFIKKN